MITFKNYKGFKHITSILDFYTLSKELGSGSFGAVNLAINLITKQKVAIKMIKKQKLEEAEVYLELMRNELEVLEKTDHPHITRVFELLEDKYNFYVVMELLEGGDLLEKVVKIEKFSEDHAVMITH